MTVQTRKTLDPMGCSDPNCNHDHSVLFLDPGCHEAPTWVAYHKATGTLKVMCAECDQTIVEIAVARSGS
jgi:hypothetical protein